MTFEVPVRVTRRTKCKEGFYLLINGKRLHLQKRADCIATIQATLDMQKFQVLTVREYQARNSKRIERQIAAAWPDRVKKSAEAIASMEMEDQP